jgi:hypothetical protein
VEETDDHAVASESMPFGNEGMKWRVWETKGNPSLHDDDDYMYERDANIGSFHKILISAIQLSEPYIGTAGYPSPHRKEILIV